MGHVIFNPAHYVYTFSAWPPVIVGGCIAVIGLFVLIKERASKVSLIFLGLVLTSSLWFMSVGGVYSAKSYNLAFRWARIEHIGVIFLPSCFFYFTLSVLGERSRFRWVARSALIISAALVGVLWSSSQFITRLATYPWGRYPQYGTWGTIFVTYFLIVYGASLWLYWRAFHGLPQSPERTRLKSFFLAFSVGLLATVDLLACYQIPAYPVGYLPVYASVVLLAQIIWLTSFPDITPAFAAPEIIAHMPSALFVFDREGKIRVVNEMACEIFEKTEAEMIGSPLRALIQEFVSPEQIDRSLFEGTLRDCEAVVRRPRGVSRICRFSSSIIRDKRERPLAYLCMIHDITAQKHADEALLVSQARLRRLLDSNIIGLMVLDGKGHITEANDAILKMLGYSRDELTAGTVGAHQMTPPEYKTVDDWMDQTLRRTGSCPPMEKEYIRKDGSRIPVLLGKVRLSPVEESCVCFVIDVTERRNAMNAMQDAYDELELRVEKRTTELTQEIARREDAEEALRNQTITDALTGLYNRRGFMTLTELHLQLSKRDRRSFWLFMADLDDLKPINDTFGHAEGDLVLTQAGTLLKQTFRESDIVARIGGDEFAIGVIEDSENNAAVAFKRLKGKLEEYNRESGHPYKIGLSMGSVCVRPDENMTIEQLMAHADAALYEQKKHKNLNQPAPSPDS